MASSSDLSTEERHLIQELLKSRTPRELICIFSSIEFSNHIHAQSSRPESLISIPSLSSGSSLSGRYPASSVSSTPSFRRNYDTSASAALFASPDVHKSRPQNLVPFNPGLDRYGPKSVPHSCSTYSETPALPLIAASSQSQLGHEDAIRFREPKKPSEPITRRIFCTFCAEQGLQTFFNKKADWKKHEKVFHETGEEWQCEAAGCFRIFGRREDFLKHQKEHPKAVFSLKQLPEKVAFGCGFNGCRYVAYSWKDRCNHIAACPSFLDGKEWEYSTKIRNLLAQKSIRGEWKTIRNETCSLLHIDHRTLRWTPDTSTTLRRQLECNQFDPQKRFLLDAIKLGQGPLLSSDSSVPPKAQVITTQQQTANVQGSHAQCVMIDHHNQGGLELNSHPPRETDATQHTDHETASTFYYTDNVHDNTAPMYPTPPNIESSSNRMSYVMDENASPFWDPSDAIGNTNLPDSGNQIQEPSMFDPLSVVNPGLPSRMVAEDCPSYVDSFVLERSTEQSTPGQRFFKRVKSIGPLSSRKPQQFYQATNNDILDLS